MDPSQASSPHLRLVLDQDTKSCDSTMRAIVWKPEDELHGHLEMLSTEDVRINRTTIYFEGERQTVPQRHAGSLIYYLSGVSRNWINEVKVRIPKILKTERKVSERVF